ILILTSEVLAACPSLVSAAILVSILCSVIQINDTGTELCNLFFCLFSVGCNYRNVRNTFPRLLNSKVEQKEDTGRPTPFSVIFLAQEKK
ncbi:hypothetical protein N332_03804, partial [Mesitornis unicolor]